MKCSGSILKQAYKTTGKETFKDEKLPIPCKAATCVYLALGTGRQGVAAAATQAHGTPGQTSTRRAPSTGDR